jgi:hypothetical protein
MDNLTELVSGRIEDPEYLYEIANALDLSPEKRNDLIKFIDRFSKYKGTFWITIVLDSYIKKQTNSPELQEVLNMAKASGNKGNNLGQNGGYQKEL